MPKFKLRFSSYNSAYPLELSHQIIRIPLINEWCFPSFTYYTTLKTPDDFDANREIQLYIAEKPDVEKNLSWNFSFLQENMQRLMISLFKKPFIVPSVVGMAITEKEVSEGKFTIGVFKELLSQLHPIFPADQVTLYNSDISIYRDGLPGGKAPNGFSFVLELGWASFFGERLIDALGYERFNNLKTCFHKERLLNGMLVILQEESFNPHNEEHRKREQLALEELGLLEMRKKRK